MANWHKYSVPLLFFSRVKGSNKYTKKQGAVNGRTPALVYTQVTQAQYESTCGCVILKMAVNIKYLNGNSGNRFEKINTRRNFQ